MIRARRAVVPVFVGLAACAPVVAAAPPSQGGQWAGVTQANVPAPSECGQGPPTLAVTRRDHSRAVALCQVAPMNVEARLSLKVFVVASSPEMVTAATLRNEGEYQATWSTGRLELLSASGKPLAEQSDEVDEIRALAASIVGWPAGVARRAHVVGQEAPELEDPVRRILTTHIRGDPVDAVVRVRFRGSRAQSWGAALLFDVVVDAEDSGAGMCHRWVSERHANGELVVRAADGAIIALYLSGTSKDTEALCPEGARQMGVSAEPKTCTDGETTFDLRWSC